MPTLFGAAYVVSVSNISYIAGSPLINTVVPNLSIACCAVKSVARVGHGAVVTYSTVLPSDTK